MSSQLHVLATLNTIGNYSLWKLTAKLKVPESHPRHFFSGLIPQTCQDLSILPTVSVCTLSGCILSVCILSDSPYLRLQPSIAYDVPFAANILYLKPCISHYTYRGADKSLARPGRKQVAPVQGVTGRGMD